MGIASRREGQGTKQVFDNTAPSSAVTEVPSALFVNDVADPHAHMHTNQRHAYTEYIQTTCMHTQSQVTYVCMHSLSPSLSPSLSLSGT